MLQCLCVCVRVRGACESRQSVQCLLTSTLFPEPLSPVTAFSPCPNWRSCSSTKAKSRIRTDMMHVRVTCIARENSHVVSGSPAADCLGFRQEKCTSHLTVHNCTKVPTGLLPEACAATHSSSSRGAALRIVFIRNTRNRLVGVLFQAACCRCFCCCCCCCCCCCEWH